MADISMFDPERLLLLAAEVEDGNAVTGFAATYLELLPGRIGRIQQALGQRDAAAAMDAVLSLKVSSSMTGARALEQLCRDLEHALRENDYERAAGIAGSLVKHESCVRRAIAETLSRAA